VKKDYIIVDGYNLIFAWEELSELAAQDLDNARQVLLDRLANYRGFRGCELVVVFDGYRVKGSKGSREDHHDVNVVYTKENETGDMYIEKLANSIGKNYRVRVVTSDGLIQLSALRSGVLRMSSREFIPEVEFILEQMRKKLEQL
jgi:predicted RNA-binding protein with PIN domain